jgi:DNA-binding beta-propeller fold protein YncE
MRKLFATAVLLFGASAMLMGQTYNVKTIAGVPAPTTATGANTLALFSPQNVLSGNCLDGSAGCTYISDTFGHKVWMIDATGAASVLIGGSYTGTPTSGQAANTQLVNQPWGLAQDATGNLYISDKNAHRIYKVDKTGVVTRFAGIGSGRFTGDARSGDTAGFNSPRGLAYYNGSLYVADASNNRIRRINLSNNIVNTVAGGGNPAVKAGDPAGIGDSGPAVLGKLSAPEGLAFASDGTMFISDTGNNRIRKVDTSSPAVITTVAGGGTCPAALTGTALTNCQLGNGRDASSVILNGPSGIVVDSSGDLIFAERGNNRVRAVDLPSDTISTIVGSGTSGSTGDGALANNARLNAPTGVALGASGDVLIADTNNGKVRVVSGGIIQSLTNFRTFNGDGAALSTQFGNPSGIAVDSAGNLYVSDTSNNRVRKIDTVGNVTTIAGGGNDSTEGAAATSASLNAPTGIAVDPSGSTIYVSDSGNNRIRRISGGLINTAVGGGTLTGEGLVGTQVQLSLGIGSDLKQRKIAALALDSAGNLYFTDPGNHLVRMLRTDGTVVTLAGIRGVSGGAGDGGPASSALLNSPSGIEVNADGSNVFIADSYNHVVRVLCVKGTADVPCSGGTIYPVAGEMGSADFDSSDTSPAYDLRHRNPAGLVLDGKGNLIYADTRNQSIRKLSLGTLVTTVIAGQDANRDGDYMPFYSGDNVLGTSARFSYPTDVAIDANGNIFITDAANGLIRQLIPNPVAK